MIVSVEIEFVCDVAHSGRKLPYLILQKPGLTIVPVDSIDAACRKQLPRHLRSSE